MTQKDVFAYNQMLDAELHARGIDRTSISPYKKYSRGYMEPGNLGSGYVTGLKVDAGTRMKSGDDVLDGIVSYDRAECKNAYIGQINMTTASSFSGVQGHVLGYDMLRNPEVDDAKPLFEENQWDGSKLPIYDAKPLQDTLVEYFGTADNLRHCPAPGSFIVCANKGVTSYRPAEDRPLKTGEGYGVWSAIAMSISSDPVNKSSMFIEDAGIWPTPSQDDFDSFIEKRRHMIAKSIAQCGQDANASFSSSWIGFAHTMMKSGEIGNAITVGPYFSLPVDSIPGGSILTSDVDMNIMEKLSLPEWLKAMNYGSICEEQDIQY